MRDDHGSKRVARFIALTIAMSLALWACLTAIGLRSSSSFVNALVTVMMAMVPAWSMIIAAVGAPPRRKLSFVVGSLCFTTTFFLIVYLTGWFEVVRATNTLNDPGPTLLFLVFRLVLVGSPFAVLVLFAGKRPSVFWELPSK